MSVVMYKVLVRRGWRACVLVLRGWVCVCPATGMTKTPTLSVESEILASPIPWRAIMCVARILCCACACVRRVARWWCSVVCVCVPARGRVVSRCRTTRTKVLVLCARVVSVGPSSCCVPNMHAKDERPDVLVDAGGLLRSVPGDPCVAADSCHKLCKFAPRCLFKKKNSNEDLAACSNHRCCLRSVPPLRSWGRHAVCASIMVWWGPVPRRS